MKKPVVRCWPRVLLAAGLAVLFVVGFSRLAVGLTPDSPEVREMVARAIGFLETRAEDRRLGAQALMGLALLKNNASPKHPQVVRALNSIRKNLDELTHPSRPEMYSPGMAILFLLAHDPDGNASDINAILQFLEYVQKSHGGWGYPDKRTGDTSMTQYCVLSSWEAAQYGFEVPLQMIDRVTIWLLKVQDPSGGFPYQGNVAPSFEPIEQRDIRLSTTAAALGSLYICADLLGSAPVPEEGEEKLPSALEEVKQPGKAEEARSRIPVDPRLIRLAQGRGAKWMEANYMIELPPGGYNYYYLYALERYWSFRYEAEGREEKSPKWYDEGARFLMRTQRPDGSWECKCGTTADTAFGVLFLVRSTREEIRRVRQRARDYGDGTLIGGRDLPSDTDSVIVRRGKVVSAAHLKAIQQVLAAMEDAEAPADAEAIEALAEAPSDVANPLIAKHADKLRQLTSAPSPEARLAAVRALSKARNMDYVPILIYALSDPDPDVVLEARDGLRRVSRKFDGFGLPDRFDDTQRRVAIDKWKQWYLAIRPDAEFIE